MKENQTIEEVQHLLTDCGFSQRCHIKVLEAERDRAVAELTADAGCLNPMGFVHGGVFYTLADTAGGAAAFTDGRRHVTLSGTLNFLHSGVEGDVIRAQATVRRRGRTTCYIEVSITNQKQDLLAAGTYTFYCIG